MRKTKIILLILTNVFIFKLVCAQESEAKLIFRSGFEPKTRLTKPDAEGDWFDIKGIDESLPDKNNWIGDLENNDHIRAFKVRYGGGDDSMRYARLINDPTGNNAGKVLKYYIKEANSNDYGRGRIQAALYLQDNVKEVYSKVRVFLPNYTWAKVKDIDMSFTWLMPMELWTDINKSEGKRSRISLNYYKNEKGPVDNLFWRLTASHTNGGGKYITDWNINNTAIPVPLNQWVTYEYYAKQGDKDNGRFYMSIQPDGEDKQVVFDVHNATQSPNNDYPSGFDSWATMKLYTNKELIEQVEAKGAPLVMFWDDFEVWSNKTPCDPNCEDSSDIKNSINVANTIAKIKLYPNPTKNDVIISGSKRGDALKIYDSTGRKVMQKIITSGYEVLDISKFNEGLYIFKINNETVTLIIKN